MNVVVKILAELGPSRSSKIVEVLINEHGLSAENARKKISRSVAPVRKFPIPLLPMRFRKGAELLFIDAAPASATRITSSNTLGSPSEMQHAKYSQHLQTSTQHCKPSYCLPNIKL